jgi:magnesium and cobalt transporter
MNEERPTSAADERSQRSWLERLGQAISGEPQDRGDLLEILRDAQRRNLLDADALHMMDGVLSVSEMQARDIMIPRSQMTVVERDAPLPEFLPVIIASAHSRFPVIGENRDEVIGILLAKDLLPYVGEKEGAFNIRDLLRPALIIPESKRLDMLLKEFRSSRNHMAVVVDEYGGVAGLVTIEDVLEQIVGEIEDEHDIEDEDDILPAAKGHWSVRALTTIEDFNDYFNSSFSDEEFDTIGGLVMNGFGHMPRRGERIEMNGFSFSVLRADNRRLYLLEVSRSKHAESSSAGER